MESEAAYSKWDPMSSNYYSFANILRFQQDDPGALVTGKTLRMFQSVCPFSKGGTCFKGGRCPYKHHIDSDKIKENPKLGVISTQENITFANDLPPKPVGRDGMMTSGIIVAIVDPGEFYIVPLKSWECACKEGIEDSHSLKNHYSNASDTPVPACTTKTAEETNKGAMDELNEMHAELKVYAENKGQQSTTYAQNELVAVKLETKNDSGGKEFSWFRAVVMEDVVPDDEGMAAPIAPLRLLDVGIVIHKSTLGIIKLPKIFCHRPPMAFKCSLFGVSPLTHKWTQSAVNTFKLFAEFQPCIFEVKRTIPVDEDGLPYLFETHPYLVELNLKIEGKYHNAAHALASEGFAIKWNLTPSRPMVSASLGEDLWNLLAAENDKPGHSLHSHVLKPDGQSIITRETNRMEKIVGRLDINSEEAEEEETEADYNSLENSSLGNSVVDLVGIS